MRELTDAEYRTLLSMLALPEATERDRIRSSGLPSSTYNVVKRRLYGQGWATDRWVPQPGPIGCSSVEVRLDRPFASERLRMEEGFRGEKSCVLLWSGVHCLLSVHFWRSEPPREEVRPGRGAAEAPATFRLAASTRGGSIPVYFDYSGLWARYGGERTPAAYPRGLDLASPPAPPRERRAAELSVLSGPRPDAEETSDRWTSLLRLPRSQRRAVEEGLVRARCVPNFAALPAMDGRRIGEVVIVLGQLGPSRGSPSLFNALTKDCGVFPFLFIEGGGKVLFAGAGQTSAREPGRVPLRSSRRSVLATVNEHLDRVEFLVEPVESLQEIVAHRYAGLFPSGSPPSSG